MLNGCCCSPPAVTLGSMESMRVEDMGPMMESTESSMTAEVGAGAGTWGEEGPTTGTLDILTGDLKNKVVRTKGKRGRDAHTSYLLMRVSLSSPGPGCPGCGCPILGILEAMVPGCC